MFFCTLRYNDGRPTGCAEKHNGRRQTHRIHLIMFSGAPCSTDVTEIRITTAICAVPGRTERVGDLGCGVATAAAAAVAATATAAACLGVL